MIGVGLRRKEILKRHKVNRGKSYMWMRVFVGGGADFVEGEGSAVEDGKV